MIIVRLANLNDISDAEVELFLSRKEVCNTYCNTVGFN